MVDKSNGGYLLETILLMMENGGYDKEIEKILKLYISCYVDFKILERWKE